MHKGVVIGDIVTVLVAAIVIYNNTFAWGLAGMHIAGKLMLNMINSSTIAVAISQINNSCGLATHAVPAGMPYAISILGLLFSNTTRTAMFHNSKPHTRGAVLAIFYTLVFVVNRRYDVDKHVDLARIVLFVSISHYMRLNKMSPWEEEIRTCWVLACYDPPLLCVAMLQLILDTEAHRAVTDTMRTQTTPTAPLGASVDIETWDVKECV